MHVHARMCMRTRTHTRMHTHAIIKNCYCYSSHNIITFVTVHVQPNSIVNENTIDIDNEVRMDIGRDQMRL